LKSHDGANFEDIAGRVIILSRGWGSVVDEDEPVVDVDWAERTERIDDCEGDVLNTPVEAARKRLSEHAGSSLGRSLIIRRGLSSIGVIPAEMTELRWECIRYEEDTAAVPTDDPKECRCALGGGLARAKTSRSNLSASWRGTPSSVTKSRGGVE
jgi:hypothetical protein